MKSPHSLGATLAALLLLLVQGISGSPASLHKRFGRGGDIIRGVNLGGLFVLEPWITPSLFKQWEGSNRPVVDEWSYCSTLGKVECLARLTAHWGAWVTESDIKQLAEFGLNHIRIPVGYWAFTVKDGEPYVQGQIPFLEKVLGWIGKHGLNAVIDLHGVPGSQNGFDNSGKYGDIGWQRAQENIERSLVAVEGIARLAQKFSDVVDAVELVNEPASWGLSMDRVLDFYKSAYTRLRNLAPSTIMVIHDAFLSPSQWPMFNVPGWENVILDTHNYHVFVKDRLLMNRTEHLKATCQDAVNVRNFNTQLWTITGEWSLAVTDCARWLNGFEKGARWDGSLDWEMHGPAYPGATCAGQNKMSNWDQPTRIFFRQFAEAQMDAYEAGSGWFFWNFKAEDADDWNYMKLAKSGLVPTPPSNRVYSRYSLGKDRWNIQPKSQWCTS